MSSQLDDQAAEFRALRRQLEESILPLATSVDGRRFELQASLHGLELQIGGYVVLESDERTPTGPGRGPRADPGRRLRGDEQRRAARASHADGDPVTPAARASSSTATDGRSTMLSRARPIPQRWPSGWRGSGPREPRSRSASCCWRPACRRRSMPAGSTATAFSAASRARGRRTRWGSCWSGSSSETDLRVIVLDPNSDYVRLGELRPEADAELAAGYADAARGIVVRRAEHGLHLGIGQLDPRARAAALALDPVADRDEFALVDELLGEGATIEGAVDVGGAARAGASPPGREPRRLTLAAVGARAAGLPRRRRREPRRPLPRRRSRLPGHARGAGRRRGGRARDALAPARRSRARPRRDRRGAQRLPAEARRIPSRRS